jgi:hypothetical protein
MPLANLVRVTSATAGTGTLTLGSAVQGFLTPTQAGMTDGYVYSYAIEADYVAVGDDMVPTSREVGTGTYASGAGTLTRSVVNSTNSNALLTLAGDEQVIICPITNTFLETWAASVNLLINGGMEVAQEFGTTSQTGVSASRYPIDMWAWDPVGAGVVTLQQSNFTTTVAFKKRLRIAVTTADASIAATDKYRVYTWVEGYRSARLNWGAAGAAAISIGFWTGHNRTGTYTGSVTNSAGTRGYTFEYTQNVTDAAEYKTVVIPGDTSGTWLDDSGAGLYISWCNAIGSNFQQAAGSWQTTGSAVFGTSNQVNGMAATTDLFRLWGVSLVMGSVPVSEQMSPYIVPPFDQVLSDCQRFYEKSFHYATAPAQNVGTSTGEFQFPAIQAGATAQRSPTFAFKARKRVSNPTITMYNPAAANGEVRDETASADCSGTNFGGVGEMGWRVTCTGAVGTTIAGALAIHWTADARL